MLKMDDQLIKYFYLYEVVDNLFGTYLFAPLIIA
jgi:hypothetical protein